MSAKIDTGLGKLTVNDLAKLREVIKKTIDMWELPLIKLYPSEIDDLAKMLLDAITLAGLGVGETEVPK
jgi:hypothetical protein